MIIANPIYDVVFKLLMQNERIAKFFIETILEETIEEVEIKPRGLIYENKEYKDPATLLNLALALVRFDFLATIKTASGEHKKVLIEIQKARHPMDIVRFRNYLGLNYQAKDSVHLQTGKKNIALPIISIYLLGFKLPEIPTPVLKVARQYIDQINHVVINKKNDFIERLTHDCHIVQIPLIESKLQTKLEQLLSVFEQKYFVDDAGTKKEYNYAICDTNMKEITDLLSYVVHDPKTKEEIEAEQEAYRVHSLNADELNEAKAELYETKAELTGTKAELTGTKAELSGAMAELTDTKAELARKEKELEELKRKLGLS